MNMEKEYLRAATIELGITGLLTALSQPSHLVAKTDARICNALRTLNKNRMRNKHFDNRPEKRRGRFARKIQKNSLGSVLLTLS